MGRRDRERIKRILAGEETPIAIKARERVVGAGVSAVKSLSLSNQIQFLADSLHSGKLAPGKLQKTLKDNASKEMRVGAAKMSKKGKTPTADLLLEEYRSDTEFQKLASEVGLDEEWLMELAESECQRWRTDN